ncbi:MAG: type IV secretion system DNA-binding domain-containing protein [Thermoflexales bacterium]|nr:type IV secretion system DNA-binding domain-containing protein [Thermoflexales bacterium]
MSYITDTTQRVIQVIPPTANEHDAQVVETLLASMAVDETFSLEIGATADDRKFMVRGPTPTLDHIARQLQSAYGQVEIEELAPANDPAVLIAGKLGSDALACGQLRLNRPFYYPLRTYAEFEAGDPITAVLGGFYGLKPGEVALAQIALSPAPDGWADHFQRPTMTPQAQRMTFTGQLIPATFTAGITCLAIAAAMLLAFRHSWFLQGLVWLGLVGVLYVLVKAGMWANEQINIDPEVTRRKTSGTGFHADIRLWALSDTPDNAQQLLVRLAGVYRLFNTAEGNRLKLDARLDPPPGHAIRTPHELALSKAARSMILNSTELAGMWHLPMGETPQVKSAMFRKFLPIPSMVTGPGAAPLGYSLKDGQTVPVSLSVRAANSNLVVVGKTQKGKSTLMGHLAASVMDKPGHALLVIAPHRDLADWLCQLVPEHRVDDVVLIDLSNPLQVAGLNLLDAHFGVGPDKLVNDIMAMGQEIWTDNWGPRMEAAFVYAAKTLSLANKPLKPEDQLTLLEIPYLFSHYAFTDSLLVHYVQDPDVRDWWGRFRRYTPAFQEQNISPVLTKVSKFARTAAACHMIGQSKSTVDFRQAIAQGKIVLVNTASGEIGTDISGFLGAVILNHANAIVREQIALDRPDRARVTVVIDEFQSIPGVNYSALLAELLKMGANFVLGTQSLTQLDRIDPQLKGAVFANVDTTAVFQCSGEDAQYLYYELDGKVEFTDLTNLDPHRCYVKTVDEAGRRLPVFDIVVTDPASRPASSDVAARIRAGVTRYTTSASQVQTIMTARRQRWYPPDSTEQAAQAVVQCVAQEHSGEDVFDQYRRVLTESNLSSPQNAKGHK